MDKGIKFYLEGNKSFNNEINCIEDLVLRFGKSYSNIKPPNNLRMPNVGSPFLNSARFVLNNPKYTYVEGFACVEGFAVLHHAWCINKKGQAIDFTWDFERCLRYFGIPINRKLIMMDVLKTRIEPKDGVLNKYFKLLRSTDEYFYK